MRIISLDEMHENPKMNSTSRGGSVSPYLHNAQFVMSNKN